MRTTLDIDIDILQLAKEIAGRDKRTAGAVISDLARKGLQVNADRSFDKPTVYRNGVHAIPPNGDVVTMAHIHKLMDEEGI